MDPALSVPVEPALADLTTTAPEPVPHRSQADRRMRRLLRLPVDAPRQSIFDAETVFGRSIAISAIRCLITYVFLPLLAPVVNLSGSIGPVLGLLLGAVSMVAIVLSMRRFFAADHKWRWGYACVGAAILVALVVAAGFDIAHLVG